MKTYAYGFPKLIENRKFKFLVESFWNKNISESELHLGLKEIENTIFSIYERYVDYYPIGEFSYYDKMLDMAILLGVYECKNFEDYFSLCRGKNALEIKKYFNTNYHYLVPIVTKNTKFLKTPNIILNETENRIPYFIGPFTFLKLSKGYSSDEFFYIFEDLLIPYKSLISKFKKVHIDEPAFVMDLTQREIEYIKFFYNKLLDGLLTEVYILTYYDSVDFLDLLYDLPIKGIGLDFIHGKENMFFIEKNGFPKDKVLIAGIVDGRNVWRSDIKEKIKFLDRLSKITSKLIISNASPLFHLPVSIKNENKLDIKLINCISFAEERLYELKLIKECFLFNNNDIEWFKKCEFAKDENINKKVKSLAEENFKRKKSYSERKKIFQKIFNLPLFPTTTIGSFPQTEEIRKKRAMFKKGEISEDIYKDFIKIKIKEIIEFQEKEGLDVLVHGEFERTDMVEFFAEKMNGFALTENGWVLSYGTRTYRPPIICGDISRKQPMTIEEISYAQSLTEKPVKGILTGPVTIIAWSYVREDVPIEKVAYQISLCLQEEIKDYVKSGIRIVQIDEPAFKEKAPIKKKNWPSYFSWAIKAFNLAINVEDDVQIHTHMCYSDFSDIIEYILQLDFDVISIESARSKAEIVKCFERVNFDREIGLGVWDIHSPEIFELEEMEKIVDKVLSVIPKERVWLNPDCGLKTRRWQEVIPNIKNLVLLAKNLRQKYSSGGIYEAYTTKNDIGFTIC